MVIQVSWWFAASITPSSTLGISPSAIPPLSLHPLLSLPQSPPPNKPQYVILPSLGLCVLIVQHLPMSENMRYFIFCSCVSLLRMMFSRFIHVPTKGHELIVFDCSITFHGVYVPHFPCPVYHRGAFGLVPDLSYCKQCCNEHLCACVLIVERFIILWIYTQ